MTVPEAIQRSKDLLGSVIPELRPSDLQLEELETPPFSSRWRFTFSAILPINPSGTLSLPELMRGRRVSKAVEIDPETGDLISVKNASV